MFVRHGRGNAGCGRRGVRERMFAVPSARERAGPVYVIRLACPCVTEVLDTGINVETRSAWSLYYDDNESTLPATVIAIERNRTFCLLLGLCQK